MDHRFFAIFDMDGTLVDSMGFWRGLCREYLHRRGITDPPAALLERIKTMTLHETAALFIETFHLGGTPEEIAAAINGLMEAHYRRDVPLKDGVLPCLERFRAAGIPMCVASATAPALLEVCLRRLGVRKYFAFLLSCEEVGCGKSRPDVYLTAARRMGAAPEKTIVFEDALSAAKTARAAGFRVAGVQDSAENCQRELKAVSDWYLERLDDPAFLDALLPPSPPSL